MSRKKNNSEPKYTVRGPGEESIDDEQPTIQMEARFKAQEQFLVSKTQEYAHDLGVLQHRLNSSLITIASLGAFSRDNADNLSGTIRALRQQLAAAGIKPCV